MTAQSSHDGTPPSSVRVLCVDDNADVLKALAYLLGHAPGVQCAGSLTSSKKLGEQIETTRAEVVLLDYNIPGESSLDALRALKRDHPEVACIVFSGYDDPDIIDAALLAGAARCLPKDVDPEELMDVIVRLATSAHA